MQKTQYLVDTDVIINYLKGMGKSKDFLMKIIDGKAVGFFSVITEAELLSGAKEKEDEEDIYDVLDLMEAVEVKREIAASAGRLRRKYAAYNTKLPDAIIAATAKEKRLILATANENHFKIFYEIEKESVKEK